MLQSFPISPSKSSLCVKVDGISRIFRCGDMVRRTVPKWLKARQAAKRASEPIKGSTKAWEKTQLSDYELDGTQAIHCRRDDGSASREPSQRTV